MKMLRIKRLNIDQCSYLDSIDEPVDDDAANVEYIFAYVSNKIAGVMVILSDGYIPSIYVSEEYRRQGIMREMLIFALRKNPVLRWRSTLNAIPYYKKIGAKLTGFASFSFSKKEAIQ